MSYRVKAALLLPGWDQCSIWGLDPAADSYYAQLYANGEPNHPRHWINRVDLREPIVGPLHLAELIHELIPTATLAQIAEAMLKPHLPEYETKILQRLLVAAPE